MGQLLEAMERETGIEPATTGLGSRCSTIELLPLVFPHNNITVPWPSPLASTHAAEAVGKEQRWATKRVPAGGEDSEVFSAGQEARRDELADA